MYLHIGNGVSVRAAEVIALCDCRLFQPSGEKRGKSTQVSTNLDFLAAAKARGGLISCSEGQDEAMKTLVITDKQVYMSPISASTLRRRQHQNTVY